VLVAKEEWRMTFEAIDYRVDDGIARLVLNRPERLNAINRQMTADLRAAVTTANEDGAVRVLVLSGAGRAFCAGYDLDWGTKAEDATQRSMSGQWDPVRDYQGMSQNVRAFMSLWESPKPVIAQVHGWCVGGGTDMALCSDLIYMAEDAQIGYPPARVWGEPTTMMWVYRLGLEHAKRLMLTGQSLSGVEAERLGLTSKAVPASELSHVVDEMAQDLATTPANQLAMSKLLVNQAYENMGLRTTQMMGTVFDGIARHTPEGVAWRDTAMKEGFREAVRRRDAPWGDYGEREGP
jgi:enoyl-CoA hydratase